MERCVEIASLFWIVFGWLHIYNFSLQILKGEVKCSQNVQLRDADHIG